MTENPEAITRPILGNVPGWLEIAFYAVTFTALALAGAAFAARLWRHTRGRPSPPEPHADEGLFAKLKGLLAYMALQRPIRRDPLAGAAHLLTGWGFFILFVGTCIVFVEHDTPLHFFYGDFYLISSLVVDLGGVAMLLGLALFLYRRHARTLAPMLRSWWTVSLTWLLVVIGVTGFMLEGARIAEEMPAFERWSAGGYATAALMRSVGISGETALAWHRALWITHAIFCVAFFALLPWRFFSHIFYSALSWVTRTARPRGQMRPPAAAESPGAVTWSDFGHRDLLQADACTTCGRCNDVCPANAAGKPLKPREVVLGLRADMNGPRDGDGDLPLTIGDDVLDSCTTCQACSDACPVGIEVFDKILDLRRGRVEQGRVPPAAEGVFESTAERFNPFGKPHADRLAFASDQRPPVAETGERIELLYWIGCAGSFDPDGQNVARRMLAILNHLGIDYRVLGPSECCTGDPARRLGEEGLWEQLAERNIRTLKHHQVQHVLTHCPHCFNAFRNEYPALGGDFPVEHHSQFLSRKIREGALHLPRRMEGKITFHDPCYLGRGNDETEAPRDVLASLPQIETTEMPRSGKRSFCCGGGGGAMWMETRGTTRVENIRAQEAADTGAGTVATGCPFCKTMLTAGNQSLAEEQKLNVSDLAELVAEAENL